MAFEIFGLGRAFEVSRVNHTNLREDEVLIKLWKHPQHGKERVQTETVEATETEATQQPDDVAEPAEKPKKRAAKKPAKPASARPKRARNEEADN